MQKKFKGFPCRICGDFPVNSQLITCKSYILFNAISTCVPKVRNYGDFRQHVIPTVITCLLRGTPCDTGFSYTFYRGNICSVTLIKEEWRVEKSKKSIIEEGGFLFWGGWNFSKSVNVGPTFIREMRVLIFYIVTHNFMVTLFTLIWFSPLKTAKICFWHQIWQVFQT